MLKLKTFWHVFKKSIGSFSYYKEIVKTKFSFSLKYLFLLLLFVSILSGIRFSLEIGSLIPKIPNFVNEVKTSAQNFYPKELVVKVQDGLISTNVKEPYYLDLPKMVDKHFITIDTKAKAEDILKYKTVILVTKDSVVSFDKESSYRVYPLNELNKDNTQTNFVIDKNGYDTIVAKLLPYLNFLPTLAIVLILLSIIVWPFIAASFALLGKLIYLFFITIIVWLISKLLKSKLEFGKIYQMGMHAITIPVILVLIFNLMGFAGPAFIPSIILIVFLSRVIWGWNKNS